MTTEAISKRKIQARVGSSGQAAGSTAKRVFWKLCQGFVQLRSQPARWAVNQASQAPVMSCRWAKKATTTSSGSAAMAACRSRSRGPDLKRFV